MNDDPHERPIRAADCAAGPAVWQGSYPTAMAERRHLAGLPLDADEYGQRPLQATMPARRTIALRFLQAPRACRVG